MRLRHPLLVHTLEMLELYRISERVVDLFELCLITRLENSELRRVQPDHTRYTGPRLCEKSDRYRDVSVLDNDVCEQIFPCVRVQIRPLSVVHYERCDGLVSCLGGSPCLKSNKHCSRMLNG